MRLEGTLCVRAGSQGERAADKLNQSKPSRDSPGSVVLLRKEVPPHQRLHPPPQLEPCLIDFIKSHRRGVWKIEDSDQTTATCLLCTAAHDERQKSFQAVKNFNKRKARFLYANETAAVSLTLNLIGRAALYRLDDHEESKEHLKNLVHSQRLDKHQKVPDELWRHTSFVCAGINLTYRKAVGLAAYNVGGCLGMSAVAAFSRRS
jgi:hypothetical protein